MKKNRICFRLNGQAIAFPLGSLSENEVRHRIALLRSANVPLDPDGVRHFLRTGQFPPPKPVEVLPAVAPPPARTWTLRQILSWYLEQPGTLQKERDALAEQDRPHTFNLRRSLKRFAKVIDLDRPPPLLPEDFQKYINARRFDPKHQIDHRNPDPESLRKEVGDVRALYNHWAINKVQPQVSRLVLDYGVKEDPDEFRPMSEVIEMIDRHGLTGDQARKLWHSSFPTVQEALDLLAHVRTVATQPWLPAITAWAIYTGCRASEARRAEVTDWEVERQAWSAREKKAKKGRITKRTVPILPELSVLIEEWMQCRPKSQFLFCRTLPNKRNGKKWEVGDKLGADQVRMLLDRVLGGTKWEDFPGLHRFRHGLRSNARAGDGVSEDVISEGVGHTTEAMKNRYAHAALKTKTEHWRKIFPVGNPPADTGTDQ